MKKVMQLSTYPIEQPLHGGQIRVSQIGNYLKRNGYEVQHLSLSEMSHGFYHKKNDFLLSDKELKSVLSIPLATDYATALLASKGKAFNFLKKNIMDFNPDIIFIEQVWLWSAVKHLKQQGYFSKEVQVIYSSQNVEYKTKESLLKNYQIDADEIEKLIQEIYEFEKEMCQEADAVIACTASDAAVFEDMGATQIVVCNNGVEKRDRIVNKKSQIENLYDRKYALFIGSAYPPNALGFWEMLGESLAWLPPQYMIIVAGGVSKILEEYQPDECKLYNYVTMDKIKSIGFVSNELLHSLIDNASVILLPITVGGGSNLKTAEAIASIKPTVATTTACRGFDFIDKFSKFVVTDKQEAFIQATLEFLDSNEQLIIDEEEQEIRNLVYWENTLSNLKKIIK